MIYNLEVLLIISQAYPCQKGLPIFKQCGNTIKVNRQMPNGEQPVLFQAVGRALLRVLKVYP